VSSNPFGTLGKVLYMRFGKMVMGIVLIVLALSCLPQGNTVQGVDELRRNPSVPLVTPIWSPSGDRIVATYVAYTDHKSIIYDYNLTSRKPTILLTIEGEAIAQSWSRDESYLAVTISQSITFSDDGIWVFNMADGSSEYVGPGEAAVWSPDGNLLATYSCEYFPDSKSSIVTVRLVDLSQKTDEVLFSENNCLKLSYMSWSPDNKKIAFSFSEDKITERPLDQIFIIDLSTKEANKISGDGSWSPSFSPDGEKVVFVKNNVLRISDKTGTCQIDVGNLGMEIIGDVSWSPDGAKWAVSGLGRLYIIDVGLIMGQDFLQSTLRCP
jgi:Tol biopolymer transport system component